MSKENLKQAEREGEKLLNMMLKLPDSDMLMMKFAETDKRIKDLKQDIQQLEIKGRMSPQLKEIKMWLHRLIKEKEKAVSSVRELINTCIGRIYVDNGDRGVIIWQIGGNTADNDSLEAIRQKESTYADECIDADDTVYVEQNRFFFTFTKQCVIIIKR